MNKLIFTEELKHNLLILALLFLSFFQFLPLNIESYGAFLLLVIGFVVFKKFKKENLIVILSFSLFYLYEILTLLYTENVDRGFKVLLRNITFLIMPIAFSLVKDIMTRKTIRFFFISYILSLFVLGISLVFFLVSFFEIYSLNLLSLGIQNWKFKHALLYNFYKELHPTYLSVSFLLGVIISIHGILKNNWRWINFFLVFFFTLIIILLSSRIVIISYIVVVPIFVLLSTKILNFKKLFYLFIACVIVSCISINLVEERKVDALKAYAKNSLNINEDNVSRIEIYKTSFSIIEENVFFGVGVGDVKNELKTKYKARSLKQYYVNKVFNSHNQYLHYLIEGGLPLFILFLLTLIHLFYNAIKNKDYLFFCFLLVIFLVLFTENLFNRINGVFFFSLFCSILYYRKKLAF